MKIIKRPLLLSLIKRAYATKRKVPSKPTESEKFPVFDYSPVFTNQLRVYSWGFAPTGALGLPIDDKEKFTYPKRIYFGERNEVVDAAVGFGFTLFVVKESDQYELYGTGLNTDSQIGHHPTRTGKCLETVLIPQKIPFRQTPDHSKILKVAAGRAHSLVLTERGLYAFGNNAYGQCGRKIVEGESYSGNSTVNFLDGIGGENLVDVCAGQDHSLVLTEKGSVYTAGWSADGQTGLGHYNAVSSFTRARGDVDGENIVKIAGRSDFVLALNDKGDVFGWGNTEYGQLPHKDIRQCSQPTHIKIHRDLGRIVDVAAGGTTCMVLNEKGNVFVWGHGALGKGPNETVLTEPSQIPPILFGSRNFADDVKVTSISAGLFHVAGVTDNGELYMWGGNKCGCLGFGDEDPRYFPLKVAIGASVKKVLCGADHTIALCKSFL